MGKETKKSIKEEARGVSSSEEGGGGGRDEGTGELSKHQRKQRRASSRLGTLPRHPQQCRGGHWHGPPALPPRWKPRGVQGGRRTGLYLNPEAEIWENPDRVPVQPQPLCDLRGVPYREARRNASTWPGHQRKSTQPHGHPGLEVPCL